VRTGAREDPAVALAAWKKAEELLRGADLAGARTNYESLLGGPLAIPARLRLSVIQVREGDLRAATAGVLAALDPGTREPELLESLASRLLALGESEAFLRCAGVLARLDCQSASVLTGMGRLLVGASRPAEALELLRRAQSLGDDSPTRHYLSGIALLQCGEVEAAEAGLEACIRARPGFARAHWALAKLRRQDSGHHHVARLEELLREDASLAPGDRPQLLFALFKELDDLGEPERAWPALAQGCAEKRALLRYDPAAEERLFEGLLALAPERLPARADGPAAGPQPIFIVGMPRSGTTLLERILGNHSAIADAGELPDFLWQMRWVANLPGPSRLDEALVERALGLDHSLLGERYLGHTQWRAGGRPFYTDKQPGNFLLLGSIARALPGARILHLVRDPLDLCFSNLRELFTDAYPYSYDQVELADHYARYRRLMAHWHAVLPGRILDVPYAGLVTEPESATRRILECCGLGWEEGCIAIERRTAPVTTASSTQVREPIHTGGLGHWRRYAGWLGPLRQRLVELGVLPAPAAA
jgi:tetratricopeptide (TPR) repeat protein